MFVSRHWYSIGIQNRMLWSFLEVDPVFIERKAKQLTLSGSHHLTIRLQPTSLTLDALSNLEPYRGRIRHLDISGPTEHVITTLEILEDWPLPMLCSISLNPSSDVDPRVNANLLSVFPESSIYVPDCVFQNTTFLRSVALKGLTANWTLLHDLVELCLTRDPDNIAPAIAVWEIALLLKQSPSLRTLKLWHYISRDRSPYQSADLPQLEKLDILDTVERCYSLLSAVIIPATTSIHISSPDFSDPNAGSAVTFFWQSRFRSPSVPSIPFLRIEVSVDSTVISVYTTTFTAKHIPDHKSAYMSLTFYPANESLRSDILRSIILSFPGRGNNITHLDARTKTNNDLSQPSWTTIFFYLRNIQTLFLSINSARCIGWNLMRGLESMRAPWNREKLPLPRLQSIDFSGADRFDTMPQDEISLSALWTLIQVVTYYSDLGHRIKAFNIRDFREPDIFASRKWNFVSSEHLRILSKAVFDLYVDDQIYGHL